MSDTFSILSPAGFVMDIGVIAPSNGGGTYGGVCVSQLSDAAVQIRGTGEHAINGRLSGRHGTMVINCTTGAIGSARAVAFIAISPTVILGVALDSSNRPYALLVDAFGTTVGQSEPAGGAVSDGVPLTLRLAWDADEVVRDGFYAGFQSNAQIWNWLISPLSAWTPFVPTTVFVGTSLGGHALGDFNGTIGKVQIGDPVVFPPGEAAEDLNAAATFAGAATFTSTAEVVYSGTSTLAGSSVVSAEAEVELAGEVNADASFVGSATFVAAPRVVYRGALALVGSATVEADADTGAASDPYPLYTSFDRNTVPWHVGAGVWGSQVTLDAPTPPNTTRQVTVNSRAEFETESAVAGSEITIATGWAGNTIATILSSDCDVIIPPGVSIGALQIGSFSVRTVVRTRIRGTTLGSHSGGRMGQVRDYLQIIASGTVITDLIVDGIDINGDSSYGGSETDQAFRVSATRVFVGNCRVIAPMYTWLGDAHHVVIANSNFYHGAASRSVVAQPEGWGIRNGAGPITVIDSRIQGTRYHNFRCNSHGNSGELAYLARCTLVNVAEGRTAWLWNNLGNAPLGFGQGAIIEDCDIYTYTEGGCGLGSDLSATSCDYSRIRNCDFFGGGSATYSQASLNAQASGQTGDHDWSVGNTFTALSSVPAWSGPGDPTAVPLPGSFVLIEGDSPCDGF